MNRKYAKTLLRDLLCARCRVLVKEFMVLDVVREENLATKICNQCIRRGVFYLAGKVRGVWFPGWVVHHFVTWK